MFNPNTIASFDIMFKGMLGSFAVAIVLIILTTIIVKFFNRNK